MTPDNAKTFAVNALLSAFGTDEASKKLIAAAAENIYVLGIAQGMNNAFEAMRKEWRQDHT